MDNRLVFMSITLALCFAGIYKFIQVDSPIAAIHSSIYRIHYLSIQIRAVLGGGGGDVGVWEGSVQIRLKLKVHVRMLYLRITTIEEIYESSG